MIAYIAQTRKKIREFTKTSANKVSIKNKCISAGVYINLIYIKKIRYPVKKI